MKKTVLFVVCLIAFSISAAAQGNKIEQTILQLEKDWIAALINVDTAALERIYSDSLTYTHSNSNTDTKAIYIANLKAGKTKYLSLTPGDVKVRVYGTTALYTSTTAIKLISNGQESSFSVKMLHVYAKEGKVWRMVAHQTTRLP